MSSSEVTDTPSSSVIDLDFSPPPTARTEQEKMLDYRKYRGKCKEYVDEVIRLFPDWKAVRGWYECPLWGDQEHWWTKKPDGTIFDPTVRQFPTAGAFASYREYRGFLMCFGCGKEVAEHEIVPLDGHVFCSDKCLRYTIGI